MRNETGRELMQESGKSGGRLSKPHPRTIQPRRKKGARSAKVPRNVQRRVRTEKGEEKGCANGMPTPVGGGLRSLHRGEKKEKKLNMQGGIPIKKNGKALSPSKDRESSPVGEGERGIVHSRRGVGRERRSAAQTHKIWAP